MDLEDRATDVLRRLIRFNTVNPPGNEEEAQHWIAGVLGERGFECELLAHVPGRPNLVATLDSGSSGPVLTLLGHVDTVLADPADWSTDPWGAEIRDGCIWGRGAIDMKSQVAAEIAAVCDLCDEGWRPEAGALRVIVTADEEAGAIHGAKWLCENHPEKVRSDMIVNEGGGIVLPFDGRRLYPVCVAEKGVFRFTLTTEGEAGHGSMPKIGDNALLKLAPLIQKMATRQPSLELSPEPRAFLDLNGIPTDDLDAAIAAVAELDPRFAVFFEPTLGVTLAPTVVQASSKINVIPAKAEVKVDCRVPPGRDQAHARARIAEVLGDGTGGDHEAGYSIAFDEEVVGNRSSAESELMDHIRDFVQEEDPGALVFPAVLPGFTDCRWFRDAFPDCVAYGFFPQKQMDQFEAYPLIHGKDERIPVADLSLAARFYSGLAPKVLS